MVFCNIAFQPSSQWWWIWFGRKRQTTKSKNIQVGRSVLSQIFGPRNQKWSGSNIHCWKVSNKHEISFFKSPWNISTQEHDVNIFLVYNLKTNLLITWSNYIRKKRQTSPQPPKLWTIGPFEREPRKISISLKPKKTKVPGCWMVGCFQDSLEVLIPDAFRANSYTWISGDFGNLRSL